MKSRRSGWSRWVGTWLAALAAAAVLVGCGSSGKATSAERASYAARANVVCTALKQKLLALGTGLSNFERRIREGVALAEQANAPLRAIPIPRGEKVPQEWLHLRELATAAIRRLIEAKPTSVERRVAGQEEYVAKVKARALARAYGLPACPPT